MNDSILMDLFRGVAVIIDDEIDNPLSEIYAITESIRERHIPVVTYNRIPDLGVIKSLGAISFIILDWEFKSEQEKKLPLSLPEGITLGDTYLEEKLNAKILPFLRKLVKEVFVPTYIFTGQKIDDVKTAVADDLEIEDADKALIHIKEKSFLTKGDNLFNDMMDWVKNNPSLYVLRLWEQKVVSTKTRLFKDLYSTSPNWVSVIAKSLKEDSNSEDWQQDFGDFLTRNLASRMDDFVFDDKYMINETISNAEEIRKVIQGERYISYEFKSPVRAYCGDLFFYEGKYLLNIRAQCSLSREDNPELYIITGKEITSEEIFSANYLLIKKDGIHLGEKVYPIDKLKDHGNQRGEINEKIQQMLNGLLFSTGELLEKKNIAVEMCVDNKLGIKFDLGSFCIKPFLEIKEYRRGRVLAPDIVKIQQKFANYIVREGVMPVPYEAIQGE